MSKGSQRRKCLISHKEESLRYDLAFGKITFAEWAKATENFRGTCAQCVDGLMIGKATFQPNYEITCRIDSTIHHQWDTCEKFREDL